MITLELNQGITPSLICLRRSSTFRLNSAFSPKSRSSIAVCTPKKPEVQNIIPKKCKLISDPFPNANLPYFPSLAPFIRLCACKITCSQIICDHLKGCSERYEGITASCKGIHFLGKNIKSTNKNQS